MNVDYDWVSAIVSLILRLEVNNLGTRRGVYDAAYSLQNTAIDEQDASLEAEDVIFMRKFLRYAITAIESDIRAGIDIAAPDYAPTGLADIEKSLQSDREVRLGRRRAVAARLGRSSSDAIGFGPPLAKLDTESFQRLQIGLANVDPRPRLKKVQPLNTVTIIRALLIHNLLQIQHESRIALLWTLVAPAFLLGIANLIYLLSGTNYVLNMDVPTFTLTGHLTWFMLRSVVFRVSGAYVFARSLLNFPLVNSIHVTMTYGIVGFLVFSVAFSALAGSGYYLGLMTLPKSGMFLLPFVCIWLMAYSLGIVFGVVGSYWPFFLKMAPPIERVMQIFASVWAVSEQLPEEYKPFVLWFPMAHGMQLLRAGYFAGYTAPDASPMYFYTSVAAFFLLALAMERSNRSRIEPI